MSRWLARIGGGKGGTGRYLIVRTQISMSGDLFYARRVLVDGGVRYKLNRAQWVSLVTCEMLSVRNVLRERL